ncbi:unnamed protein product [Calicophoron daubneyi]|uniref:Enkurin domain-containing protein n=1 Tax=Calicophoron daubneyi TaxID=300641 RepID=A0AAV2T5U0_CALDB
MSSRISGPIPSHDVYLDVVMPRTTLNPERSAKTNHINNSAGILGGSVIGLDTMKSPPYTKSLSAVQSLRGSKKLVRNYIRENIRRLKYMQNQASLRRPTTAIASPAFKLTGHHSENSSTMAIMTPRPMSALSGYRGDAIKPERPRYQTGAFVNTDGSIIHNGGYKDSYVVDRVTHSRNQYGGSDTPSDDSGYRAEPSSPEPIHPQKQYSPPRLFRSQSTQFRGTDYEAKVSEGVQTNGAFTKKVRHRSHLDMPNASPRYRQQQKRKRRPVSAERGKHDFLKAHEKTASGDWNLLLLGSLPIKHGFHSPKPEQLTVPKASSARKVQLIRRDINYVRANAHLASATNYRNPKGRRPVSAHVMTGEYNLRRSVSTDSESEAYNSKAGKWPERRLPIGAVPHYIIKRRQEARRAALMAAKNEPDPDQPPGHRKMSDKERRETLVLLKNAHNELSEEWNRLPVRMDTLRIRTRRAELERRLGELEQAITIFSKPKVFVKPE